MVTYTGSLAGITSDKLQGFFVCWPNPPTPAAHLRILQGSTHIMLAVDDTTHHVIGFITAISDGVSAAYIPHLEVLPSYQRQGIGSELFKRMFDMVRHIYMVDLTCDPVLKPFYEPLGMRPLTAMIYRNFDRQSYE